MAQAGRGGNAVAAKGGAGGDAKGGAIEFDPSLPSSNSGPLSVNDSLFAFDTALAAVGGTAGATGVGQGGAIAILGGTATLKRPRFSRNHATTAGDDIHGPYSP